MTRPQAEFNLAKALTARGFNDCEISRVTGIPRATVRDWRLGRRKGPCRNSLEDYTGRHRHDFRALPGPEYSYLLGMYLGDGYIARCHRGVWRLQITSDGRYPGIIEECAQAMESVMPGQQAGRYQRKSRCVDVAMYSKHWPCFFPQHGPGRKHERTIRLEPWQERHVDAAHENFVRGLIHSDGCRVIANDRGVRRPGIAIERRYAGDICQVRDESCQRVPSRLLWP